mgnify:CR=1 FL=1
MQQNNLSGALTGMLVAAAANWARYDDDTQRRLRNIRNDAEAALRLAAMDPPYQDRSGAMSAHFSLLFGAVGISYVTTPAYPHPRINTKVPKSRRWDLIKRGYEHPHSSESCIVYPTNWERLLEEDAL